MSETLLDYDADASTRLWELLERRNISCRDQLKQSVDTAGAQLEWFKPSAMGPGKHGARVYVGPAVAAPPGTFLIVLAHDEKAFTVWLRSPPGMLTAGIEEAVAYFKSFTEDAIDLGLTLVAIENLIKKHGRVPDGKRGIELSQEHNARIIGMLFAAMSDRASVCEVLEMIVAKDACPAMAGLIGKGSVTGLCGVWPLTLPLAPYVDAVLET